ncbi:MAG: LysM peptidoglycan-binding domain-containing protein [bacterium]
MQRNALILIILSLILIGCSLVVYQIRSKSVKEIPLWVPATSVSESSCRENIPTETIYEVKKGDTLWDIARRFGCPVEEIVKSNNIKMDKKLQIGEKLRIPLKGNKEKSVESPTPKQAERNTGGILYQVKERDSLWAIARKFGVSVEEIAKANGISANKTLQIGEKLRIPKSGQVKVAQVKPLSKKPIASFPKKGIMYQVRAGDTLWTIGRRFGVSPQKIAEANNIGLNKTLQIGEKLLIPGVVKSRAMASVRLTNRKAKKIAAVKHHRVANKGKGAPDVVTTALNYRGVRYSYGGFSSRGFDCSGFVKYVYQRHGLNLPHNAAAQYRYGKPVNKSELRPGDLVFFRTGRGRGINHVGIYIGDGKFIHASSARGRVRIDSLNEGYYKARYVGARRLK